MAFLRKISSPPPASDGELMAQYRQTNDLKVLGDLFEPYMELVYGVCLKYLKQPEDAQDSVIAIFEELAIKLRRHEVEHFRAWLHTVAKNHCLMRLRSEKKQRTVPIDSELMQSEENLHLNGMLEKEGQFQKMENCLAQLPEEQRRAVELFYLEGKCYKEISASTGLDWNKVRSYIQNGRRNLKICMESENAKAGSTIQPIVNDAITKK